jgi:hypothetical protein
VVSRRAFRRATPPKSTNRQFLYILFRAKAQELGIQVFHKRLMSTWDAVANVLFVLIDSFILSLHNPKSQRAICPVKSNMMFSGFKSLRAVSESY